MIRTKFLLLSLIALTGVINGNARVKDKAHRGMFENPVVRQDVPDPTIIRCGKLYYMASTSNNLRDRDSREANYPQFVSKDLVNWQFVGHILTEKPAWTINSFWAPELFEINGRYYCYYTARNKETRQSGIGVAVAGAYDDGRQAMLQELTVGPDHWPHFVTGTLTQKWQSLPFKGKKQK